MYCTLISISTESELSSVFTYKSNPNQKNNSTVVDVNKLRSHNKNNKNKNKCLIDNNKYKKNDKILRVLSINIGGKFLERLKYIIQVTEELKIDIIIISEIKRNKNKLDLISKLCKGWIVNIANKNNKMKGGVALMYRNTLKTFVKDVKIIDNLNAIECKLKFKKSLNIIGLYATSKNKNKENYWNKWMKYFHNKEIKNLIMSGDFNIQIDQKMDNLNSDSKSNNQKIKSFHSLLELGLTDIWREKNKEVMDYSFRRISKNKEKKTRIDLTLVSNKDLIENIWIIEELNELSPDHRGILTDIVVEDEFGKIIQTSYDEEIIIKKKVRNENMNEKNIKEFNKKMIELNEMIDIKSDINKYYEDLEKGMEEIIEKIFGYKQIKKEGVINQKNK